MEIPALLQYGALGVLVLVLIGLYKLARWAIPLLMSVVAANTEAINQLKTLVSTDGEVLRDTHAMVKDIQKSCAREPKDGRRGQGAWDLGTGEHGRLDVGA